MAIVDKNAQRKALKEQRAALGASERARMDALIADNVAGMVQFRQASVVFTYLSFGAEIDTRELIRRAWECGKTVALPYCIPGTRLMEWHVVTSFDDLVTSSFGVDEPKPVPETLIDPAACTDAVALVPGLSFDSRGYRMGYGGGFYDIFLSSFAGVSVGLCRSVSYDTVELALEPHDVPVNYVATDEGVISAI